MVKEGDEGRRGRFNSFMQFHAGNGRFSAENELFGDLMSGIFGGNTTEMVPRALGSGILLWGVADLNPVTCMLGWFEADGNDWWDDLKLMTCMLCWFETGNLAVGLR